MTQVRFGRRLMALLSAVLLGAALLVFGAASAQAVDRPVQHRGDGEPAEGGL